MSLQVFGVLCGVNPPWKMEPLLFSLKGFIKNCEKIKSWYILNQDGKSNTIFKKIRVCEGGNVSNGGNI